MIIIIMQIFKMDHQINKMKDNIISIFNPLMIMQDPKTMNFQINNSKIDQIMILTQILNPLIKTYLEFHLKIMIKRLVNLKKYNLGKNNN